MNEIIKGLKSAIEPKEIEIVLKEELRKINSNSSETLENNNQSELIINVTIKYKELFADILRKLISDLEHNNTSPEEQQDKAVCLYLETRKLRMENTESVVEIHDSSDISYTREDLITYFASLSKQLLINHLLIPMANYLESNYIDTLSERSVFPQEVLELMTELARDICEIVTGKTENNKELSSSVASLKVGNQFRDEIPSFSLRYNGFQNLYEYKAHINMLFENFKLYMESTREIIRDAEKLKLFHIYVTEHLNLLEHSFSEYKHKKLVLEDSNPLMIRKEAINLVQDNISGIFKDTVCTFHSEKLHRMMDLQYHTVKASMNVINSEFTILKKKEEILQNNSTENNSSKIMLKISADRFYFLLRMLVEEKVLYENTVMKLFRKVNRSFRTIIKKDLSVTSMHNKYYSTDKNCADFWVGKFTHMKQRAMKVRDGGKW